MGSQRIRHDWILTLSLVHTNQNKVSSVQFSCSVLSDSLRPQEPQHARLPCLSPVSLSLSLTHTRTHPWLQCPKPYSALLNLSISSIGQAASFLQLPAWCSALVHGMNMKYTKQKVRMKYFFSTLLQGNLVVFLKKRFLFNYKHTVFIDKVLLHKHYRLGKHFYSSTTTSGLCPLRCDIV